MPTPRWFPALLPLAMAMAMALVLAPRAAEAHGTCGSGGLAVSGKVMHQGKEVNLYVPPSYDGTKPLPLVLALHGDEGTADKAILYYWPDFWSQKGDFILVAPSWGGSWWQDYDLAKPWMEGLLESLFAQYNVDTDRIYGTGVSGGSTFLAWFGVVHQDIFAAIQYSCGGASFQSYVAPPKPECKVPARFVLAADDFMHQYADPFADQLKAKGHDVTSKTPGCSGHCCGPWKDYVEGAYDFFSAHPHCKGTTGPGCGKIGDLPGSGGGGSAATGGSAGAGGALGGGASGSSGSAGAGGGGGTGSKGGGAGHAGHPTGIPGVGGAFPGHGHAGSAGGPSGADAPPGDTASSGGLSCRVAFSPSSGSSGAGLVGVWALLGWMAWTRRSARRARRVSLSAVAAASLSGCAHVDDTSPPDEPAPAHGEAGHGGRAAPRPPHGAGGSAAGFPHGASGSGGTASAGAGPGGHAGHGGAADG